MFPVIARSPSGKARATWQSRPGTGVGFVLRSPRPSTEGLAMTVEQCVWDLEFTFQVSEAGTP